MATISQHSSQPERLAEKNHDASPGGVSPMNSFKRLLVVSDSSPYPPTNGSKLRFWGNLRSLAANGHEVDLLYFGNPEEADRPPQELVRICRHVEVVPHVQSSLSTDKSVWPRLKALLSAYPYGVARSRSESMSARVAALIRENRVDAVLCEESYQLQNIPRPCPVPLIVDNHNAEYVLFERYAKIESNLGRRTYARIEARKMRRWEKAACARANLVLVCSGYDKAVFEKLHPRIPVVVVPNAIDVDSYVPAPESNQRRLLYTGGMDWYPNRDAVEHFAFRILPQLKRLTGDIEFVVAGRSTGHAFHEQFSGIPEMQFTGPVPDMRVEIAKAAVCIVPLRIGSGTRLKILEAAAMGKPVVSSSVGAEGLEFIDGEEIVIADTPGAFAQAVANLLADAEYRRRIGEAARRRVQQNYSLDAMRRTLDQGMTELRARTGERAASLTIPNR